MTRAAGKAGIGEAAPGERVEGFAAELSRPSREDAEAVARTLIARVGDDPTPLPETPSRVDGDEQMRLFTMPGKAG